MSNTTDNEILELYTLDQFKPASSSSSSSIVLFYTDTSKKIRRCIRHSIAKILFIIFVYIATYLSYLRAVHHNTEHISKTVRIAHCMTGSPRTLYKEEVYVAYRRQALNILPGDLFVVLQTINNKIERIHGTPVTASVPERYDPALKYLSPRKIEWIREDDHLGAKDDRSGYGKWQRCLELIEEVEKQNGTKYDYIVRSRPDLFFAKDLPTADLLPKDRILVNAYYDCIDDIPSGYNQTWSTVGSRCDEKNSGISDLFAIVPRALADTYMRVGYASNLPLHICGIRADHAECAIKAALYKANITYEIWPFVVKIMRSVEFCRGNDWNRFNGWC